VRVARTDMERRDSRSPGRPDARDEATPPRSQSV
jgi:hypothetical protein